MTTKTRKPTTKSTTKEETMPKTHDETAETTTMSGQDKVKAMMAEYDETIKSLRKKHAKATLIDQPINPITGRPLNKDAKVVDDLRYFAAEYGWTDNRFATTGQIAANGGKLPKDANTVTMFFPMGERWRFYRVANLADVTWPDGNIPDEFAKKSGKSAKATTKKATAKKATTSRGDKALRAEVEALKATNAELSAKFDTLIALLASK